MQPPDPSRPLIPPSADAIERRYFTIGEVAELLGVNRTVLRFWETEFEQIRPRKTRKGRRLYSHQDLDLLRTIHYLVKVRKYTLQGAREALAQRDPHLAQAVRTRETLLRIKNFLQEWRARL